MRKFWLQFAAFVALFVNFFYLFEILLQLLGQIYLSAQAIFMGHAKPLEWTLIDLPFEGRWKVVNGGVSKSSSHSWSLLTQRYAYDFLIVDHEEESSFMKGEKYYPSWGCPLYAPVSGVVVKIKDNLKDHLKDHAVRSLFRKFLFMKSLLGNHIVIRIDSTSKFVLLAHLQKSSCIHSLGDKVHAGDYIGRCGNSGLSTEPHLHMHVQDGENFFFAKGLPIAFNRILVDRNCIVQKYQVADIQRGDDVENMKSNTDAERKILPEIIEPYAGFIFLWAIFSLFAVIISIVSFYHMVIFQWILH